MPIAPLALICLGASLWPELELLVPSLPAMKEYFGVSQGEIQQLLSWNFAGFLCGILLAGPLCDSLGRKKVCLLGGLFFIAASYWAASCSSFAGLSCARFLQGLAVTAPIIAGSALLLELTSGRRQIFWMSISSAAITLCMAGAPILGSWINGLFGFQGNLWAIFLAGVLGIIPVVFLVPESLPKEKRVNLDMKTIARGYWQLLKNRQFMGMSIIIAGLPAAYWVYTGVSSLYLVDYLRLDPALFGTYQGPIVGTFAILSISISWINKRFGLKACLIMGFWIMLVGATALVALALFQVESALLTTIFMMCFVGGMVPVNSLLFPSALNLLPHELQGSGQSMIQALRLLISTIGTVILSAVYEGPFLPVALILALLFAACSWLLWRMRHVLTAPSSGHIAMGH